MRLPLSFSKGYLIKEIENIFTCSYRFIETLKLHAYTKITIFPPKMAVIRGAERYMNERERMNRSGDICVQTGRKVSF